MFADVCDCVFMILGLLIASLVFHGELINPMFSDRGERGEGFRSRCISVFGTCIFMNYSHYIKESRRSSSDLDLHLDLDMFCTSSIT